jgi:hypothetical protein
MRISSNCASRIAVTISVLSAVSVLNAAPPQPTPAGMPSPQKQVRSFLTFHLAHPGGLTPKDLQARKRWLTPTLYRLLQHEVERETAFRAKHPDDVPFIDGDVFLNSQEVPNGYRIATSQGNDVPVHFQYGKTTHLVRYRMQSVPGIPHAEWRINDVISEGESLVKTLQRPNYDSLPEPKKGK